MIRQELIALENVLHAIPDKSRVNRLLVQWKDQAQDLLHLLKLEQSIIELSNRPTATPIEGKGGELLTTAQACKYLKVGITYFIELKTVGLIQPAIKMGHKFLFSKAHLNDFLAIPIQERNRRIRDHRRMALRKVG